MKGGSSVEAGGGSTAAHSLTVGVQADTIPVPLAVQEALADEMAQGSAEPVVVKRVQYSRLGPSSVLEMVAPGAKPARSVGQVLVENKAASVNPVDAKLREGYAGMFGPKLPATPGGDVAGVVLEADAGSKFKPGDRVMALLAGCVGGYCSHVVVPESALARIPDSLSFEEAASLPLVALTAWQALDLAQVQEGQRVLIHAGAGGVGSIAIQLAKTRGLHVITTCSAKNAEFVRQLGADEVIDYSQQPFEEVLRERPVDAVLDAIVHGDTPNDYEQRSIKVLKKSGVYVNFVPRPAMFPVIKGFLWGALGLGPRYRVIIVRPDGAQLEAIAKLAAEGRLKPIIHSVLPLERAAEAQEQVFGTGHMRGKIVLKI